MGHRTLKSKCSVTMFKSTLVNVLLESYSAILYIVMFKMTSAMF